MILKIVQDWFRGSNKLERFWLLAKIEFKLRYYENKLGLIWALAKPIFDITVYYIAFEIVMHQGIPNFVSYLFLGLILWNFFIESTMGTVALLETKKYLYEYTNMNKIEIYISVIGSGLIGMFFNLCMFLIYYLVFQPGSFLTWHSIFLVPIIVNLVILSLGCSLILSTLYVVAKDIHQVWHICISLGFWLSPLVFKLSDYREKLPGFDYFNPISNIIINSRDVILYHKLPELHLLLWGFVYSLFFLLVGIFLLNKLGSKAAEKL